MKPSLGQAQISAPPATAPAPIAEDAVHATAGRPAPSPLAPHRTRVLCVDDAPDITEMLARLVRREPDLEDAGALDSAEGIAEEVVRRRVDVVVLDLNMPGPSPIEAIPAIAARAPSVRVIVYSGYDDPATRAAVRRAGASEVVSKNAEPADLIRAIRRVAGTLSQSLSARSG